jgi:hypothetical protein
MTEWKELRTFIKPIPPSAPVAFPPLPSPPLNSPQTTAVPNRWLVISTILKIAAILIVISFVLLGIAVKVGGPIALHAFMVEGVKDDNKKLPTTDTNGTRIDSESVGSDNTVHLHVTLTKVDSPVSSEDIASFLASNKAYLVEQYRGDTKHYLSFYFGWKYEYDFYNSNGDPVGSTLIGYDELK